MDHDTDVVDVTETESERLDITAVAEASPLYHFWRAQLPQHAREIPESLLRLAYAMAPETPSVTDLVTQFDCDEVTATDWHIRVSTWLLPPQHYEGLRLAEAACADRRAQRWAYNEDVRATQARLAQLDHEIQHWKAHLKLPSLLEDERQQTEERIATLDKERVDLLRHQGDLPGVERVIAEGERAVTQAIEEAQASLTQAWQAHLETQAQHWRAEAEALVAPLLAFLAQARQILDPLVLSVDGKPENLGSGQLKMFIINALRTR